MRCRPPAEHNFLIESIKAWRVYSRIMIVVNKLMQSSRSHGINVNRAADNGCEGGWQASSQRNNLKTTVMSRGDFPYLGEKTAGISRQMVHIAVKSCN